MGQFGEFFGADPEDVDDEGIAEAHDDDGDDEDDQGLVPLEDKALTGRPVNLLTHAYFH
jgi:hypothetical protein